MALTNNDGNFITQTEAVTMTTAYRNRYSGQPKAYFFGRDKISTILGSNLGLRIYFANDANGNMQVVVVGVDSAENDILNDGSGNSLMLDRGVECPTNCSPTVTVLWK